MTGFYDLIGPLLDREGGYVNHKSDRGGATNKGITQATYSQWRGNHGMAWQDVGRLTTDEAEKEHCHLLDLFIIKLLFVLTACPKLVKDQEIGIADQYFGQPDTFALSPG